MNTRLLQVVVALFLSTGSVANGQASRTDRHGDPLPEGAITRMGTLRFRCDAAGPPVLAPDGKTVVVQDDAPGPTTFRAFDTDTGKVTVTFRLDVELRRGARLAPDGRTCVGFTADKEACLCDVRSGKVLRRIPVTDETWRFWLSPTGRLLALADAGGAFRLLELPGGKELPAPQPAQRVGDVCFTPDERYLVLSATGQTPLVWDLPARRLARPHQPREENTGVVAVLGNSGGLLTIENDDARGSEGASLARVVGLLDGRPVRSFRLPLGVYVLQASADGGVVAALGTGREGGVRVPRLVIWGPGSGEPIGQVDDVPEGPWLTLSADGGTLVVPHSNALRIWKVEPARATGRRLAEEGVPGPPFGPVSWLAFTPDGRQLLSAGADGVLAWEVATGRMSQRLLRGGGIWARATAALRPDGRVLVTDAVRDRKWRAFEPRDGRWEPAGDVGPAEKEWLPHRAAFTRDGSRLALGNRKAEGVGLGLRTQALHVLDATGKSVPLSAATRKRLGSEDVAAVALAPDGKTLAVALARWAEPPTLTTVLLLDLTRDGGVRAERSVPGHAVTALAFSPDGKVLAAGGGAAQLLGSDPAPKQPPPGVVLWEPATGTEVRRLDADEDLVQALAFSPDGTLLATAGEGGTARLWEVTTGREVRVFRGHAGAVRALAFSPDGKTLATGSEDATILLWDAAALRRPK